MTTYSYINSGSDSSAISVECSISRGLPSISIVGMANKAVDESKERIRSAITKAGYSFPKGRIVINLAPADLPKDSASLDLAIAIAILATDQQIKCDIAKLSFIGELSLDGKIRPVRGVIGKLISALKDDTSAIIIPEANLHQAMLIKSQRIIGFSSLKKLVESLNTNQLKQAENDLKKALRNKSAPVQTQPAIDFGEIVGQEAAKRALLIAASGGHNVLLSGPPGTGKSMLAKAFIGILPDLEDQQTLESTHIHSLALTSPDEVIDKPPLRAPHHSASDVSIIGGGHNLRPGEISLAHNGVLFLDELPEFSRVSIEALRQPLEDKKITIARAQKSATFPARFILIATSNPCPCGHFNSTKPCVCSAAEIQRYQKKLSGPIIDRIDIFVTVSEVEHGTLLSKNLPQQSHAYREIVTNARLKQKKRQGHPLNAHLADKLLKEKITIDKPAENLLVAAAAKIDLSARAYMRTIRVAQTIADLSASPVINQDHIAEALQYRAKAELL